LTITHEFFEGDRVSLEDASGTHYGTVRKVWTTGLITVEWDSGTSEKCLPTELTKLAGE